MVGKFHDKLTNWIHNYHEWKEFFEETCTDDIPCQSEYNNDGSFDNKDNDNNSYSYNEDADSNDGNDEECIKVETKEDDDIFKSISGGDLKKKMSQNVAKPSKCKFGR